MELKTKKLIAIFGCLFVFLGICIMSVYAYLNPNDTFFAASGTVFAMILLPLYYFGRGVKETRQKHIIIKILIIIIVPMIWISIIVYRWWVDLPALTSATSPTSAFLIVWGHAFVWFIIGAMTVISGYADEIVEKVKNKFGKKMV
jgi:hypothetical protein